MAYIGYPIVGDEIYSNGKNEFGIEGQMLHAKVLGFNHPITHEYLLFSVDPPKEFEEIINTLRKREQ